MKDRRRPAALGSCPSCLGAPCCECRDASCQDPWAGPSYDPSETCHPVDHQSLPLTPLQCKHLQDRSGSHVRSQVLHTEALVLRIEWRASICDDVAQQASTVNKHWGLVGCAFGRLSMSLTMPLVPCKSQRGPASLSTLIIPEAARSATASTCMDCCRAHRVHQNASKCISMAFGCGLPTCNVSLLSQHLYICTYSSGNAAAGSKYRTLLR